jgi:glycosyltransferase involved in cell wall biosynthesis
VLDGGQEIITYAARNLEPHRGYHQFICALPMLLRARPQAQVVIVGGEDVSYSPQPPKPYPSWRAKLAAEEDLGADAARVHHVGRLANADYLALLRVSSAHVYYSYPFVLSWSCLEAMAVGCAMVASDTAPVREVIDHEQQGLLFPFFDGAAMVAAVCRVLDDTEMAQKLRHAARKLVVERYELRNCLRQQLQLIAHLLTPKLGQRESHSVTLSTTPVILASKEKATV